MKLIVGLGNPGKEYENTRHNVGFMAIDNYKNNNLIEEYKEKFNGYYLIFNYNNEKVILLKPLSYMNLSGEVVKRYVDYFDIDINDVIVIYDDMDYELGVVKIKKSGSAGGHNGMKNIIQILKTENIKRIRIGISRNNIEKKDYVLGKFNSEEKKIINDSVKKVDFIIKDYLNLDFEKLMNKYN